MKHDTLQNILEAHFQWFHRHPELSFAETKTTAHIRSILAECGVAFCDFALETGVVAQVGRCGGAQTPNTHTVALRADIDALPIVEASGLPYTSENAGCMHACGHDFHLTALLGAAMLLQEEHDTLPGAVKLLFQPGEEKADGARRVLETGILDGVSEIYGLHVTPELDSGIIAISPGATYAAVGGFNITVRGKGGHAAEPHHCIDPIPAAAQIINAAQTIVSRNASPFDQVLVSITHVTAGNAWNIIPDEAVLEGTIRALGTAQYEKAVDLLGRICTGIAESSGTEISYAPYLSAPSTNNDPALCDAAAKTARALGLTVVPYTPAMLGEDFALYQEHIRGVFLNVGVGSPAGLHQPKFRANPAGLADAAELLAALARQSLASALFNIDSL